MTSMLDYLRGQVESRWYGRAGWLRLFTPLAALYQVISTARRKAALAQLGQSAKTPAPASRMPPVIVVGNIVVGGTGKTPVVMHVVERLRALGAKPGVVARGYGARSAVWPRVVTPRSNPRECGDEAVELATVLGCPVVVGPDRAAAARWLSEYFSCDVIVSDDGLQHYRLRRSFEFAIVDAERRYGNGDVLPVGPLREPVTRLQSVDCVITTARSVVMEKDDQCVSDFGTASPDVGQVPYLQGILRPVSATHLRSAKTVALADAPFVGDHCVALSGIGNPKRFHEDLSALGCTLTERALADHSSYSHFVVNWPRDTLVVTTGKDAVKLVALAGARDNKNHLNTNSDWLDQVWVLNRQVVFSATDEQTLTRLLTAVLQQVTRDARLEEPC